MKLEELGFDSWFKDKLDSTKLSNFQIARVIAVNKESYIIKNEKKSVFAEITGKIVFCADSPLDYPTVGDWIYAQYLDNDSHAIIHESIPRKSVLKRKKSGRKVDFQLIAANIDTAFIIQSLDSNFNLRRLERYLVMVNESNIRPVVLLSKSDLISKIELEEKISKIHSVLPDIQIVALSNINNSGFEDLKKLLIPGKTHCLIGSSGVGKTTLLNNLLGKDIFETNPIRIKDEKGRHTTTRRQLVSLENCAMIIDTPGMRELGNFGVEAGINDTFSEIAELENQCRYNNCTHILEEDCAVLSALHEGIISSDRYQNFLKMKKESAYFKMSYLDKRRKDKAFGKMYKSVMKDKKNIKF